MCVCQKGGYCCEKVESKKGTYASLDSLIWEIMFVHVLDHDLQTVNTDQQSDASNIWL